MGQPLTTFSFLESIYFDITKRFVLEKQETKNYGSSEKSFERNQNDSEKKSEDVQKYLCVLAEGIHLLVVRGIEAVAESGNRLW